MKFFVAMRSTVFLALAMCLFGTTPAWARLVNGGTPTSPLNEVGGDCGGTLYAATTEETYANLTGSFTNLGSWNAVRFGNGHAAHLDFQCDIGTSAARVYGGVYFGYSGNVDGSEFAVTSGTIYTDRFYTSGTGKVSVVVTGGTMDTLYGVQLGITENSMFEVTQTGGTVSWAHNGIVLGGLGSGTYTISGGSLITIGTDPASLVVNAGSTFHIDGARATIFLKTQLQMHGTTIFTVHADGVSPIEIGGMSSQNQGGTIDMALAPGVTPQQGALFDLIDTDHTPFVLADLGLTLSPEDVGAWEFAVKEGDYTVLQARYLLPEPATLTLLGLGMFGLVIRHRH